MKKIKKNLWEKALIYPSFNTRFCLTLIGIFLILGLILYMLLKLPNTFTDIQDRLSLLNLFIQAATLFLGIFAAYYALRQLVETRFTELDQAGSQELTKQNYSRAFDKWKEASYIRPDPVVFLNLMETLLIIGDYDEFDAYIKRFNTPLLIKKHIFIEASDRLLLAYLKAIRHLLVKNQGEAEKHISSVVEITLKEGPLRISWNFWDVRRSISYQNFKGECKTMAENLISYISEEMSKKQKEEFIKGNYAFVEAIQSSSSEVQDH